MKVADKRSSVVYHHLHVSLFVRGSRGDFFPTAVLLFIAHSVHEYFYQLGDTGSLNLATSKEHVLHS